MYARALIWFFFYHNHICIFLRENNMSDANKPAEAAAADGKQEENVVTKTAHTILGKVHSLAEGVKDKAHDLSVTVKEKTQQLTHHDHAKANHEKKDP